MFTIGVEEEFHVIDPITRVLVPDGAAILDELEQQSSRVGLEMHACMIETSTPVCRSLTEVRDELGRLRRMVVQAAGRAGRALAACGTAPLAEVGQQRLTPGPRYERMLHAYQQVAREQLICACHTHVGFDDRDLAIEILNRARPWISTLLALSASSPFWAGADTGFASYRSQVWTRWPTAGPPAAFASASEYDLVVKELIASDTIGDESMVYWDLRPSARQETLEVRIADSCATVDETVLQAGLFLALARTCHEEYLRGDPPPQPRHELLQAAKWRAGRFGVEGELLDVTARATFPAAEVVARLLEYLRPALERHGDWDEVFFLTMQTLARGTASARQRRAYQRQGRLEDVVDMIVTETAAG